MGARGEPGGGEATRELVPRRAPALQAEGTPAEGARLTATCLINHYDYGRYVERAIASALAQTRPFDEIVVVDDGSDDGSREALRRRWGADARVTLIEKPNQGQLSAFNVGFERSAGDVLFFLDADDEYEPEMLARVLRAYEEHPRFDFTVCAHTLFGEREGVVRLFERDTDLGFSAVLALSGSLKKLWISPTSTLSMRRRVLELVLPVPYLEEWRVRADDCLTIGSSLAGARKLYLAQPLVRYRVHAANRFHGRAHDLDYDYRRHLALRRLMCFFLRRMDLGDDLWTLARRELETIPRPRLAQLRAYARIVWRSRGPLAAKLSQVRAMLRHTLRRRLRAAPEGPLPHA